jgi:hypothetical protein
MRKSDVLRFDEVQEVCTRRLHELGSSNSAAAGHVYWLRGIYWEHSGEIENAMADYKAALACGAPGGDLLLRLGDASTRFAVRKSNFQRGQEAPALAVADDFFRQAEKAYAAGGSGRVPPHLYTRWGDASLAAYRITGDAGDARAAHGHYRRSEELAPHWFLPPHLQGVLLVAVYDRLSADARTADTRTLLQAVQCLSQAIRLNPNAIAAYRERAEALLRLARAAGPCEAVDLGLGTASEADGRRPELMPACSNPSPAATLALLNEALRSAERAYELGNNREPRSLEIKANVQRALAVAIYPGHPPLDQALDAGVKAKIATAQALLSRASQLAEAAANYSQAFDEIDRRLTLATECNDRARRYADYLNGDKQILIAEARSRISKAKQGAQQLVALGSAEQERGLPDAARRRQWQQQQIAAEQLLAEAESVGALIGESNERALVDRRQWLGAVTKLEQRVSAVQAQAIAPGTWEAELGKPVSAPADRAGQLAELRATIEEARAAIARLTEEPASAPPRPTYRPLFLSAE